MPGYLVEINFPINKTNQTFNALTAWCQNIIGAYCRRRLSINHSRAEWWQPCHCAFDIERLRDATSNNRVLLLCITTDVFYYQPATGRKTGFFWLLIALGVALAACGFLPFPWRKNRSYATAATHTHSHSSCA